jgi:hypothetical protein
MGTRKRCPGGREGEQEGTGTWEGQEFDLVHGTLQGEAHALNDGDCLDARPAGIRVARAAVAAIVNLDEGKDVTFLAENLASELLTT